MAVFCCPIACSSIEQSLSLGRRRRRSIEQDRSTDTNYKITCNIVEIYNEVVHDLLSKDVKRQVELQKTATGFDMPSITEVGAFAAHAWELCYDTEVT